MTKEEIQALIRQEIDAHEQRRHTRRGKTRIRPLEQPFAKHLDLARKAWPGAKRGLEQEWINFTSKHDDWRDLLDDEGLHECVAKLVMDKAYSPGFWPRFATWVNQRRWEEALQ